MQVDPLAPKYVALSPYTAFANNPIIYVDYDGRDVKKSVAFKNSPNREAAFQAFGSTTDAQSLLNKFASSNSGDYTASVNGALSQHDLVFDNKTSGGLGLTTLGIEVDGKFVEYNAKDHAGLVNKDTRFQIKIGLHNEKNAGAGAAILNHEAFVFAEEYANNMEAFQNGGITLEDFTEKLGSLNEKSGIQNAYMKVLDPNSTYTSAQKELVQNLKNAGKATDAQKAQETHQQDIKQIKEDYSIK